MKNILRLLFSKFYSKQENELVGHQSFPSSNSITLLEDASVGAEWVRLGQWTAPSDGYAIVNYKINLDSATADSYAITQFDTVGCLVTRADQAHTWQTYSVPVTKGFLMTLYASHVSYLKVIFKNAVGNIGGG